MARRKKPAGTLDGPVVDGPDTYFAPRDLAAYELARARLEVAVMKHELLGHRIEAEQRASQARTLSMRQDQAGNARVIESHTKVLSALEAEIAGTYEIDLADISYDDVTGKISTH